MEKFNINQTLVQEKNPSTLWEKVKDYTKVSAFAALVALPGVQAAHGQESEKGLDTQGEIGYAVEKAASSVKDIVASIKENGQPGTMNGTPVWRLGGVVVGYSEDKSKALWVIQESSDASMRYFDAGANGSVDRVIMNKDEGTSNPREKSGFNDLKTFASLMSLYQEAQTVANLEPENTKVYEFINQDGGNIVRSVDFQTGQGTEVDGEGAAKLRAIVQGKYGDNLKNFN